MDVVYRQKKAHDKVVKDLIPLRKDLHKKCMVNYTTFQEYIMRNKQPDEMFCSECGGIIKKSANFCSYCGVKREEPSATPFQESSTLRTENHSWDQQIACPQCGRIINPSSSQCPHCNTDIEVHLYTKDVTSNESQKNCKNCGNILGRAETKCSRCGISYSEKKDYTNTTSYTSSSASDKKRLPALLFVLFLPVLGAHRFYVGKTGSAIAMIFGYVSWIIGMSLIISQETSGILFMLIGTGIAIWQVVDLVMIITGSFTDIEGKPLEDWT